MKKIILSSLVAASAVFGANDAQIKDFYTQMIGGRSDIKIAVGDRQKIADGSDIEAVNITISDGKQSQNEIIFTKGDYLLPEVIDIKAQKSYLNEFKQKAMAKAISSIYGKEDTKNIISIGNDPKKPTLVVFTDPECPYCRSELDKIETTLKESNVKIILTPVHELSALQKSHLAYKEANEAKTDSDKIKALRKYYAADYKVADGAVSEAEFKRINDLRNKYLSAGVRSVPFIINESELKK